MYCHAYGTVVHTNVAWPLLTPAPARENGLSVELERVSTFPLAEPVLSVGLFQGRTLKTFGKLPDLSMQVDDTLRISFNERERRIHCLAKPEASDALIEYWLLRQFIPIAKLLWDEVTILHAGAVHLGDGTAAFLAHSGTGKSTLVGQFVSMGHTLVTDDQLLVVSGDREGRVDSTWVLPTIPYYRNYRQAECLGRYTTQYDPAPSPLKVIYVLKAADPAAAVQASPMSHSEAALELLHQAPYRLVSLDHPEAIPLARRRFEYLSQLPLKVPVRRLDVPRDLARLSEVAEYIKADMKRVERS